MEESISFLSVRTLSPKIYLIPKSARERGRSGRFGGILNFDWFFLLKASLNEKLSYGIHYFLTI